MAELPVGPASNCDGNTGAYGIYNTSNKAQAVGVLLAIPPSINMESLNLKTAQSKKIFQALQDYDATLSMPPAMVINPMEATR